MSEYKVTLVNGIAFVYADSYDYFGGEYIFWLDDVPRTFLPAEDVVKIEENVEQGD